MLFVKDQILQSQSTNSGDNTTIIEQLQLIMADSSAIVQADFPADPDDFANDPRISWSRLDNKHILETEGGAEYEWDTALRRWVAVVSRRNLCNVSRTMISYVNKNICDLT